MKTESLPTITVILAVSLAAATATRAMEFMEYSPITHFTEGDHRLADQAGLDALENHADGETRKWSNTETGASGAITLVQTYKNEAGHTCRRVRAVDRTKTPPLQGEFVFDLCKDPQAGWQFVPRRK